MSKNIMQDPGLLQKLRAPGEVTCVLLKEHTDKDTEEERIPYPLVTS